jgi:hypothetical protein
MAITYSTNTTGTLSPPILNGIEQINSTNTLALSSNDFTINSTGLSQITLETAEFNCNSATFGGVGTFLISNYNVVSLDSNANMSLSGNDTTITGNTTLSLNSNNAIEINNVIKNAGLSTTAILALTPSVGMQCFCNTINQMVFYQVSPITGLVLGWYNSTGNIKL